MKRLLFSALSGSLLLATVACSNGDPNIMSPTAASSSSTSSAREGQVAKFYTVGGVVQSIYKPLTTIAGARIDVSGGGNDGVSAFSDGSGAFSVALRPGTLTITVSKPGFEAWSTTLDVYDHHSDLHPMLRPTQ